LAQVASEFGIQPSHYFTGLPETTQMQIDTAAAVRLWRERNKIYEEHQAEASGMVYL
jgi:hypothetical protein